MDDYGRRAGIPHPDSDGEERLHLADSRVPGGARLRRGPVDRQLCVTGSGKRAVVVYAPRTFANDPKLMARGGFSAVVDLASGGVTKLKVKASLSYYNPGCGTGEQAVLTQSPGEDRRQTRLLRVDAGTGKVAEPIVVDGQITSSVSTSGAPRSGWQRRGRCRTASARTATADTCSWSASSGTASGRPGRHWYAIARRTLPGSSWFWCTADSRHRSPRSNPRRSRRARVAPRAPGNGGPSGPVVLRFRSAGGTSRGLGLARVRPRAPAAAPRGPPAPGHDLPPQQPRALPLGTPRVRVRSGFRLRRRRGWRPRCSCSGRRPGRPRLRLPPPGVRSGPWGRSRRRSP